MASISTLVDHNSVARWLSQIEVAAEFLAHELLQQQLADRLQRGIGQQQFGAPAAVFHVDAQLDQDRGIGGTRDGGEARIGFQAVEREIDRRQRFEGGAHVLQDHFDHALHQGAFDGGVGTAFDAHRRRAAAAAQKHVDDGIDQVGIDGEEAVIVQFLGMKHRQDRGQGNGIEIVAEADRGDGIQADFDIVGGEIAQGGGHQPHQAVEDDFQHRQAFIGDQRRIDDGADAGFVLHLVGIDVEAQKGIDFFLVEDAFGACRRLAARRFGDADSSGAAFGVWCRFRRPWCFRLLNDHLFEQTSRTL